MEATDAVRARPRDWAALALLAVPCMLVSVNSNLLNLAFPAIAADLQPTSSELLWISDIYVFLVAGLLLPFGVLADRFGRRRLLLAGAAVFGSASIAAVLATGPLMLIACRGAIGVGAAMVAPSTLSLIRSMFRIPEQRSVALGIWTASFALGGILGPLVGGTLIQAVSWRAIFAVTPPVMAVLLVLGPALLPEYRSVIRRRIDVVGIVMAIAGVLGTVYALKQLSTQSAPLVPVLVALAGAVLLVGFIRRETRIDDPILDVTLFRNRAFAVPQAGNALAFAVLYDTQLLIGQYLQSVLGLSPLEAGIWTIPSAAAYAIGGLVAPRLGGRFGAARVLAFGLAVSAAGFAIVAAIDVTTGLVAFTAGSVVYSLGLAPVYQATTESSIAAVPTEQAGVAGATLETITNLGGALGIALFGSIASAIYRMGTARLDPATESIGDVAGSPAVVETAQYAFVTGFRTVEVVGAATLLVTAVVTLRLMPARRGPHS